MAEKDVTGKIVEQAGRTTERLRDRMARKIPLGPTREFLTKKEIRQKLQEMDPQTKEKLMREVGDEEWRRMIEDLYSSHQ